MIEDFKKIINSVEYLIYLHILKNRDGETGIIRFFNNLQFNRVDEF